MGPQRQRAPERRWNSVEFTGPPGPKFSGGILMRQAGDLEFEFEILE